MVNISGFPYREIKIDGVVSIPEPVTEEIFWGEFIQWVESRDFRFNGVTEEIQSDTE